LKQAMLLLLLFAASAAQSTELISDWRLASSATLAAGVSGVEISKGSFDASGWLQLNHFPATVLAALASNGSAPRPDFSLPLYYGRNNNATKTALFDVPWWYRCPLPASVSAAIMAKGRAILTFKGINYRANVWVNGVLVAPISTIEGAFRYFDVDMTTALLAGGGTAPALAVEVYRSYDWGLDCKHPEIPYNQQTSCRGKTKAEATDLSITFVDWAPAPHDANLGLWRGVDLNLLAGPAAADTVTVRYPQVTTRLSQGGGAAELELVAELQNWGTVSTAGVMKAQIPGLFSCTSKTVSVAPGGVQQVVVSAKECEGLVVAAATPMLWWPWQMGKATQHNLTTAFVQAGHGQQQQQQGIGDEGFKEGAFFDDKEGSFFDDATAASTQLVGLRDIQVANDANGNAVVRVNGKRILIRGGGWAPVGYSINSLPTVLTIATLAGPAATEHELAAGAGNASYDGPRPECDPSRRQAAGR
jgi:exo-1,4-beta-D-glucosaminidase